MADTAAKLEPIRQEIADAIASCESLAMADIKVGEIMRRHAEDSDLGDSLFVPQIMADMAGSLMVKGREAQQVQLVATGQAQDPRAFLNLPWVEAIEEFKARGVISEDEMSTMLKGYAEQSVEARRLMLERIQKRVRELLVKALEEGQDFRGFAADLAAEAPGLGITNQDPAYLNNVFRTNVQSAYGAGRVRSLLDPDVQEARPFVQYRTVGDSRVRDSHALLDGAIFRVDDPEWLKVAPPNGFQCFPGDTLVSGVFNAGIKGFYSGEIVELRTKSGGFLSVTPNHPVATRRGFVAAHEIKRGDHVLSNPGIIDGDAVGHVDEYGQPARIDDVYRALSQDRPVHVLRPVANDLHGDGARMQGEIHVVGANGVLGAVVQRQRVQDASNSSLRAAGQSATGASSVDGDGRPHLGLSGHGPSTCRRPRGTALALDSVPVHAGPFQDLSLGPAANVHASRYESATDYAAGNPEFIRKLLLGHPSAVALHDALGGDGNAVSAYDDTTLLESLAHRRNGEPEGPRDGVAAHPGLVKLDEVVYVGRRKFVGHVYDLQSPYGWLLAGGMVTSNCRCSAVSLSIEDAQDEVAAGTGAFRTKVPEPAERAIEGEGFLGPPGRTNVG